MIMFNWLGLAAYEFSTFLQSVFVVDSSTRYLLA